MTNTNPIIALRQKQAGQSVQNTSMQQMNTLKQFGNILSGKTNPIQMLSMIGGDNGLGQVMEYIQKNGGDAKSAFYNLANQLGADPQEVLSQAKEMMNK